MGSNITVTAIVATYLLFMPWIGWYSSTKISSSTDFMVAGRRLGPLLMAGMLAAMKIGGNNSLDVVQNGTPGYGLSVSRYITTMGIIFIILSFIAPKFRAATVKTAPEYFCKRYGKPCGLITAIIMLLPLVGLTAGQFIASAVIFSTMLGINYQVAVIIVAVVATVYSIMGGLWSVTLTDPIQVFPIVIGMIIVVLFALNYVGSWGNVTVNIPAGMMNLFEGHDPLGIISLAIVYMTMFSMGQEAVSRSYAVKDEKAVKGGAWLAALVNSIYAFIPTILGIIVLALINMGKFNVDQLVEVGARYALPVLTMNAMPVIICGLLFAGIISATMSSSDLDLLGTGSISANDIYKAVLKPDASSKSVMSVTKIVVCLVGLTSMPIALFNTQSIISIPMFCSAPRAVGSFSPYVMGHYWEKASAAGTTVSPIAGIIVVVYLEHISGGVLFGIKFNQPITSGLVVAFTRFIIFSYLKPPAMETMELAPEEED